MFEYWHNKKKLYLYNKAKFSFIIFRTTEHISIQNNITYKLCIINKQV